MGNFVFYESWGETYDALREEFGDAYADEFLRNICLYGIGREMTTTKQSIRGIIMGTIAPNINKSQERYQSACEGGKKSSQSRKTLLSDDDNKRIAYLRSEKKTAQQIADIFGVSLSTIKRSEGWVNSSQLILSTQFESNDSAQKELNDSVQKELNDSHSTQIESNDSESTLEPTQNRFLNRFSSVHEQDIDNDIDNDIEKEREREILPLSDLNSFLLDFYDYSDDPFYDKFCASLTNLYLSKGLTLDYLRAAFKIKTFEDFKRAGSLGLLLSPNFVSEVNNAMYNEQREQDALKREEEQRLVQRAEWEEEAEKLREQARLGVERGDFPDMHEALMQLQGF